jgi:hypothetical protein
MLGDMFRSAIRRFFDGARAPASTPSGFPVEELRAQKARHERAPLDLHTGILFGHAKFGGMRLLDLYDSCLRETATPVSAWKTFARIRGAANLARYFLYSLGLEGARAECGVFQGFSALFVCRAAALSTGGFDGTGLHLVDSFEGFPQPRAEDFILIRQGGSTHSAPAFARGDAAVCFEQVSGAFRDFPGVRFHRGFIPQALGQLPDTRWAFVHIDVDLHAPTLACLDYFYPRMTAGGVIICDDFGSTLFPGARKAWETYCAENEIAFVALETGQSVLIK